MTAARKHADAPTFAVTYFEGDEHDVIPAEIWNEYNQPVPYAQQRYDWTDWCVLVRVAARGARGTEKGSNGFFVACEINPATDESLAETERRLAARGRALRPAVRRAAKERGYRDSTHIARVSMVVVDYDQRPAEQPDWQPESWPGQALWHTTHRWAPKHDPETECGPGRHRVYIPLARPITHADYSAGRKAFAALLPRGAIVRAAHQPAFLPTSERERVRVGVVEGDFFDWSSLNLTPAAHKDREVVAAHGRALDLTALENAPALATKGVRHDTAFNAGAWAGSQGFTDEAIEAAFRQHFPTQDPEDTVTTALDGARIGREGGTTGWKELGGLVGDDVRAELEQANQDPTLAPLRRRAAANDTAARVYDQGRDAAVDDVIAHLAAPPVGVFQRAGMLCTVTREARTDRGMVRPTGTPTIRTLAPARLKEIIRTTAGSKLESYASEVAARGEWHDIRPLDAIVTYPIMRRDGSLLLESGYDATTHTLAELTADVHVPGTPTRGDARAALEMLDDLVCDFPFASDAAKSAWLAMLLTVPARPAIDGPTPLGLLEATQRGSGKTLLADLISLIATGNPVPRRVAPKTKEEWDKSMLATLAAGDPLVLIDNITTMLVSDALDAVLTGTTYSGRWLGVSENRTVAVRTVFLASSNNARLSTDLVRRSIACRLEPDVERPEARTGFRHEDLAGYAKANRAALLGAALTILRAYVAAGRPRVEARRMGSYDAWCRVVRDALVWAGAADPAATQDDLRESADVERDELRELLMAWHEAIGTQAVTVRALLERCEHGGAKRTALLDALRANMPNGVEPTKHAVGNKLRTLRGQIADGLALQLGKPDTHTKTATYRVVRVR